MLGYFEGLHDYDLFSVKKLISYHFTFLEDWFNVVPPIEDLAVELKIIF